MEVVLDMNKQQLIVVYRNNKLFGVYDTFAAASEVVKHMKERDPLNNYTINHIWRTK